MGRGDVDVKVVKKGDEVEVTYAEAQGQQQAGAQQQQAAYGKARAACLEGRGYSVK